MNMGIDTIDNYLLVIYNYSNILVNSYKSEKKIYILKDKSDYTDTPS